MRRRKNVPRASPVACPRSPREGPPHFARCSRRGKRAVRPPRPDPSVERHETGATAPGRSRRQPRTECFLQWFGERDGSHAAHHRRSCPAAAGLASGRRITVRLAGPGRSRRAMKGLLRAVNSVPPRRVSGTGRPQNGHEIDAETGQRCAWIGNEMVPKWYPARNGTSARSGKSIHNLLI